MSKAGDGKKNRCEDEHTVGTAVLGERGQLVVPKEIRERYDLKAGDHFMVMGHGNGPIVLVPVKKMHAFLSHVQKDIEQLIKK